MARKGENIFKRKGSKLKNLPRDNSPSKFQSKQADFSFYHIEKIAHQY